jgi:predicted acyl esterase
MCGAAKRESDRKFVLGEQYMRINRQCLVVILGFLTLTGSVYAGEKYSVKVETNVAMKTRDGINLRADIYRPEAPGNFPVIPAANPIRQAQ